ncbi:hypothetical protein MPTK1_1g24640 [Marchantia polymorpha subsp. ruderalis]|uniref:HP domain-containing protein n=2 Tax=Marchantia polymorpha TaxID=3197 RepID=A0AAF6ATW6_MARPO|nr:hypothetical protein MARPO_0061s0057 [Marchantia polymorpha]PTQ36798.1 hypothetical protein MARPO_0061s0057 [Marchantia polymorpha]BBM99886.1 hypothetical protein Mp_1g24640 [Marchantia polymorpha subsp. ruderalis]BBM99887.1 hypothetical protein Mp_1g24640 [Marchantia polymorpha subsp. ruderalis]|eukprot:PTQ36797.1 hypothetical protein MARPO_0061s0057 [Marchantia polymorpha]
MAVSMKNVDVAFHNVGGKAGTEVWRIENFSPVLLPKSEYGKFHEGDSYIVLRTTALKSGAFHYDVHFWLGKSTSQDEAGAAAIKTVELDAALGGRAVQYRECQGHETDLFLSYFKPCIIPLEGGIASGFKKVEEAEFEPRLYLCKGARLARVTEVPYARQSLNHDDVFILDTKEKIYQFNGANSSIQERGKALEVVQHLKDTNHDGDCDIVIVDDGKLGAEAETGEFWSLFGGFAPLGRKHVPHEDSKKQPFLVKLFCVGEGKPKEVEHGPVLKKNLLDTHNCFLLDAGNEMFVWMGRETTLEQRKAATLSAEEFISSQERPTFTQVTRIIEGFELPKFKAHFEKWPRTSQSSVSEDGRGKVAALLKQQGVDVKGLLKAAAPTEDIPPPLLESSGKLEVWRVDGTAKTVIPPEDHGKFFDAHCYIVLYTYHGDRKEDFLLCTWLGKTHSADEQSEAVKMTSKMADKLKGRPVQVRVFQGKEPPQFLALFPCLIIMEGKTIPELCKETKYMIRVQGTSSFNSLAIQVDAVPASLNSSECFVLSLGKVCYMWSGNFTNTEHQKVAMKVAGLLKLTAKPIREGTEPSAFWNVLGGKQTGYPAHRDTKDVSKDPRLFQCTYTKGKLEITEVFNFEQDDLLTEEVMILDTNTELYVWVGQHASVHEKQHALDFAQEYLDNRVAQDGMSPKATIYRIPEGNEPLFFGGHFPSWSATKVTVHADTYTKRLANLRGQKLPVVEHAEDGTTQRKTAMAALSSVFGSPGDYPTSPRSSVGGSPRTPSSHINSASSQRAAALAALSAALGQPQPEQTSFAPDADWVAVSSPSIKSEDGGSETGTALSEQELEESSSADGTYEYERLKATATNPVRGIDLKKREAYLSDEAFEKLFTMKKDKFYELPKWKQDQRKRVLDLF